MTIGEIAKLKKAVFHFEYSFLMLNTGRISEAQIAANEAFNILDGLIASVNPNYRQRS